MARGGLGVRHAQADKIEKATKYRLTGVRPGSRVAECLDKYGRWELGHRLGHIMRNSVTSVTVQWDDEDEFTYYNAGDARYKVDRNLWRITPPREQNVFELLSKNATPSALTRGARPASIMPSPPIEGEKSPTEENNRMPTKRAVKKHSVKADPKGRPQIVEDDELDDLEIDDEPTPPPAKKTTAKKRTTKKPTPEPEPEDIEVDDDEVDDEPQAIDEEEELNDELDDDEQPEPTNHKERETYTAKQVATRIGTDAKTLRKFFRSPASTVEAVGQGGRYEFDAADMPKIKAEFEKWNAGKGTRTAKGDGSPKKSRGARTAPTNAAVIEEDDELLELDDEEEPTDEELEELEELDDDELDD